MPSILTAAAAVARTRQMNAGYMAPLRPALIGPVAGLHRFAVTAEQALLGSYNPTLNTTYSYPNQASGSIVDLTYPVELWASTALLNYFNKYVGIGGSCQPSTTYPNQVRAASYVFVTNSYSARSSVFGDRDVQIGDVVVVSGTVAGSPVSITSSVTGFVGDPIASTVSPATSDSGNATTQSLAATVSQVPNTPVNEVVATINGAGYESTADGYINRTYTVTVIQSSTGGNATTGRLSVVSADGLDNVPSVTPSAFGTPTAIGTKGLLGTFTLSGSPYSSSVVDQTDLVVGQQFIFTVSEQFTAPVATSGGTYTGTKTTTYVVQVSPQGGLYSATTKPQIVVTSSNGYDSSGPTTVTGSATAIPIGNFGVTISFSGTKLRNGDKYYVVVTAATTGIIRTLVLKDNIPSGLAGTEVNLQLYAQRTNLQLPNIRPTPLPAFTNWVASETTVVVNAGINVLDPQFTNGGVEFLVPMSSATLYVQYREWLTAGIGAPGQRIILNNPTEIFAAVGTVTPDNPLAYAASCALANTDGQLSGDPTQPDALTTDQVYLVPLGGAPTTESLWVTALQSLENEDDVYQLVPLTADPIVFMEAVAQVEAQSQDSVGFYSVVWLQGQITQVGPILNQTTTTDGNPATATITATSSTSPVQYTTLTASSNVAFITEGVLAGDQVHTSYGVNALGQKTWTTYTIAAVLSNTSLLLVSGPATQISPAIQFEVWRNYTTQQNVAQLLAQAASFNNPRVRLVWPDTVGFGGTQMPGYFLNAALAQLSGSVPSQQSLRFVSPVGFDDLTRTSKFFTNAQVAQLGAGGVYVVTQTPAGVPYVAFSSTTDPSSTGTREEMIVRNADMLIKAIQSAWAPYVGTGNVISTIQAFLIAALNQLVNQLKAAQVAPQLGPPVGGITIASLTAVPDHSDQIAVVLNVTGLAVPLNQIQITLPVSVT